MRSRTAQAFYVWRQYTITARQRKMRAERAAQWYTEVGPGGGGGGRGGGGGGAVGGG